MKTAALYHSTEVLDADTQASTLATIEKHGSSWILQLTSEELATVINLIDWALAKNRKGHTALDRLRATNIRSAIDSAMSR